MTKDNISLPDNDCDTLGTLRYQNGTFYIDSGVPADPECDDDTYRAVQHELVDHQTTRITRHRVYCDVSKLRLRHFTSQDYGFWIPYSNTVHLFEYVPLDPKYPEGTYILKQININGALSVYHEVRHAYNQRCIWMYNANQSYKTWALDELMARTAEWLAAMANMPEISGPVTSIHVDYPLGPTFDQKIACRTLESALDNALYNLYKNLRGPQGYQKEWLWFESDPEPNFIQTGTSDTAAAWRRMRTFMVHGHPIDIYDCIKPRLRRAMDKLIHARPRDKRTGR
ncbi:hypothetical protein HDR63_04445 [bacterium]|nr:hypothetical protein [bacterium]